MRRPFRTALLLAALLARATPSEAQLISPGKLSSEHADLEGLRQCTQCHELGQRGTSNERCLSCHTVLRSRVAQGRGYHATMRRDQCSSCHKDHLGRSTSPLRFDSAAFKHDATGYALAGAHVRQGCRECHAPANITATDIRSYKAGGANFLKVTYLGLATDCSSCHNSDAPHGQQFAARSCHECHEESDWKRTTRFDHGSTRYALRGAHVNVKCADCHPAAEDGGVQYRGVPFGSCADCHRDPHRGQMPGTCARCHSTVDWRNVERKTVESSFDHARTRFALRGAHKAVTCARCHAVSRDPQIHLTFVAGTERSTFPRPVARTCSSCHVDPHPRSYTAIAGAQTCASCHGLTTEWRPVSYDVTRHNRARNFLLDGAHVTAPCSACHKTTTAPGRTCISCHAQEDPHRGAFGKQPCGECHNTADFKVASLDHARVKQLECASCHGERDPHRQQFGQQSCGACHGTATFRVDRFDHSKTRYALDGAHVKVACSGCHTSEKDAAGQLFVRYKPVRSGCKDCHGAST